MNLYDKNRIPLEVGDVFKLYHFSTGRKHIRRYFMYKWVLKKEMVIITNGPNIGKPREFFTLCHLHDPKDLLKEKYILIADESIHPEMEIVQGYGENSTPFEERQKALRTTKGLAAPATSAVGPNALQ